MHPLALDALAKIRGGDGSAGNPGIGGNPRDQLQSYANAGSVQPGPWQSPTFPSGASSSGSQG